MHGILIVDKPAGITSHDVVSRVRRAFHMKRVGHAGTLDPGATGVLLVCLGQATRVSEFLMGKEKQYLAVMALGSETTTEDWEGEVTREQDCSHVTPEDVLSVLPSFTGEIQQIPPMVSAIHHEGKRLYELARKNVVVERKPRSVMVHSISMTAYSGGEYPRVELDVTCSKGTYIRTICADIGRALGCPAHMGSLIRTRVGNFGIKNAVSLEAVKIASDEGRAEELLMPIDQALEEYPVLQLDEQQSSLIKHGVILPTNVTIGSENIIRLHDPSGELIALGRIIEHEGEPKLHPEKVFVLEKDVAD